MTFKKCICTRKIPSILGNPKQRITLEDQGVYEIPCGNCKISYIEETNRRIGLRARTQNSIKK